MTLLALLAVCGFVFFLGRFLVRHLGWPTDMEGAGRWGLTLLILAVLFTACPEIVRSIEQRTSALPDIEVSELLPVLVVLGLAVLGYIGWTRGAAERERRGKSEPHTRLLPRRRAAPPAPFGQEQDQHDGFQPLGPHDDQPPDWP